VTALFLRATTEESMPTKDVPGRDDAFFNLMATIPVAICPERPLVEDAA
jgi:hypothetical protein